jgi:hypothetical protein
MSCRALLSAACLLVLAASPAQGATPRFSGAYSINGSGVTAGWAFDTALGGDSDGSVAARLTSAGAPDVVRPCDAINGMGTITIRVPGVADAAARLRLSIRFDLRRGVGHLTLSPERQRAGLVLSQEITACDPPADAGNGTVATTYDATLLFEPYHLPRSWTVRRQRDGSWTGSATQQVGTPAALTHTSAVRLTGGAAAMNAGCLMPTASELRSQRTLKQATAFIARAGFTRPRMDSRFSPTVPRGRFFLLERLSGVYGLCGRDTVTLVQSRGRP